MIIIVDYHSHSPLLRNTFTIELLGVVDDIPSNSFSIESERERELFSKTMDTL